MLSQTRLTRPINREIETGRARRNYPMLRLKRVYDPPSAEDGYRILIDRLWPRGLKRETADIDLWLKGIAPSHELRRWFGHDPERWEEFQSRYRKELAAREPLLAGIACAFAQRPGDIGLRRKGHAAQRRRGAQVLSRRQMRDVRSAPDHSL